MPQNYYEVIKKDAEGRGLLKKCHNPGYSKLHFLEMPFRMLILGPSGSMKTNTLIDLIKVTSGTWNRIIVCCKSKEEPLYQFMELKIPIEFYEGISEVPTIEQLNDLKNTQTLIVFDDLVAEKNQKAIVDYFLRGRKFNISMVYISQNYYSIPKIIRSNATYIIFKSLANINDLKMIFREYSLEGNLDALLNLYKFANSEKSSFFMIDSMNAGYYKNWKIKLN